MVSNYILLQGLFPKIMLLSQACGDVVNVHCHGGLGLHCTNIPQIIFLFPFARLCFTMDNVAMDILRHVSGGGAR